MEPCTLIGKHVRLEPLGLEHLERLAAIGVDPELWRFTSLRIGSGEQMRNYIEAAVREREAGVSIPFATIYLPLGLPVGSTRFMNISREHRRVEIGSTWVAASWQRSVVNTEAKYLQFRHAFESWSCNRVELKTSLLNRKSQAAIVRAGATEEGILRRHMINDDGSIRDTVYFSIISEEWPARRARLEAMLTSY